MRPVRYTIAAVLVLLFCQLPVPSFSQLGFAFDIKKPTEYEERTLRSERSDQGKFSLPTRLIQNTVTHFNYYFNANNKLNEVLERAKSSFKDDYSRLLSFYNYTLDATAKDSVQLDSIAYKSSTGIALHDLRNDWVDNLYLLWGAAYYLKKEFDSAYLMFQFINYAFAPKEKDGYYLTIGSNRDGNSAFSIATKEKNSLPKKIFSQPPSRNDAFIWQIRNFLAQDQMAEASSLIVTLRNDPNFPKRLQNDLHEVQAYWFYKQNMWDSAAHHLVNALSNATNKQEQARWEYLAAQLYELGGNYKAAEKYYTKVIPLTTDPILDIYARLSAIRTNKDNGEKDIAKNVAELIKMAKRDKYQDYRDIIYYMAAQMQLEGHKVDDAMALLLKSTQYTSNDVSQRNKAFLQLAELSFARKQYRVAYNFYDSIKTDDPSLKNPDEIIARKKSLGIIAGNLDIISREDSLQRIAAMPENERRDFVKKLVKELRKKQGLKDDRTNTPSPFTNTPPVSLFPTSDPKAEWYFYNTSSRTRGQNDFKVKWGNRPNVDNWRRSTVIVATIPTTGNQQPGNKTPVGANNQPGGTDLTFDALYAGLPLTPEQLQRSNDSLQAALFRLGKAYIQEIEDCEAGTDVYERLRTRFPQFRQMDEVLFNLYYCYNKNGETAKAAAIKKLMAEKYASSKFTAIVTTGKNPSTTDKDATRTYERIYDLFIEGQFEQAVAEKKTADSVYGKHYWTPQLLYIESVYYIKQRNDSTAIRILTEITNQFSGSPLAPRAAALINVLKKRTQIEESLRDMTVVRATDSTTGRTVVPVVTRPSVDSSNKPKPLVNNIPPQPGIDSMKNKPGPKIATPYRYDANAPHYVVLVLNKVDPVFSNEAKNAFDRYHRDAYPNKSYSVDLFQLDTDNRLLMVAPFTNAAAALAYIDTTKPKTATEIIPWLKGGKYSYLIMTDPNFDLLKTNKDIETYRTFLNQYWPGRF